MRRPDPVREQKQAERQKAHMNLQVLLNGIGSTMKQMCWHDADEIRMLVEKINTELVPAVDAAEAAEKAYEPYWGRRRRRYIPRNPKGKKRVRGKKP